MNAREAKVHAERLLNEALKDPNGYIYPSQIKVSKNEFEVILNKLLPYGRVLGEIGGANPVFQINDFGRSFVSAGGWSEKERKESLDEEARKKTIELSKENNVCVKLTSICSFTSDLINLLLTLLKKIVYTNYQQRDNVMNKLISRVKKL